MALLRMVGCLCVRFSVTVDNFVSDIVVRAVHKVLEQRYHNNAWPATKLRTSHLLSWILKRVNEASGPYQMFGVLGDIVLLEG